MKLKELDSLFQPIKIGSMELKNRLVMAPMGTGFPNPDGTVNQRTIDYYAERAKGEVGLIIVEGACVDAPQGSAGFRSELRVDDDRYIDGLRKLTDAIHNMSTIKNGTKVSLQLLHAGRYSRSTATGLQPVAPSPIASRYTGEMPRELSATEAEAIIEKFAEAARRAREAGFDAIELIGSTGYLISQFFSPLTNKRTDRFGGDVISRCTFVVEIIQHIREKIGSEFPVDCKLSVDEYLPGGTTIEDSKVIAKEIEKAGGSMLHAWAGWHESPVAMLPMSVERGAFVFLAEALKQAVSLPIIAVGRINEPLLAARIITEGKADLVAMGRALLADPYLPKKAAEGDLEDIRKCIACCRCFDNIMSSIKGVKSLPIICSINAEMGREGEGLIKPTNDPKRVLVVGGGPAGMETARVAALRGHTVTLWEERDRLGGNLNMAVIPPHKEEINNLIEYLSYQMRCQHVKVELGKKVTPEVVLKENADVVVIASGAIPITPEIPGVDRRRVITAIDALSADSLSGKEVVIIGGGLVGCETSEYLTSKGKKVTVIARREAIATDVGPSNRWVLLKRLRGLGIQMLTSIAVKEITANEVVIEREGRTETLKADLVVLARGLKPRSELWESLSHNTTSGKVPRLYTTGDCSQVGKILEAIHDGFRIGCEI